MNSCDLYFKSYDAEIIYGLLHHDGRARHEKLGVFRSHYTSRDTADAWLNNIMATLKSSQHPHAEEARKVAHEMHALMVGR